MKLSRILPALLLTLGIGFLAGRWSDGRASGADGDMLSAEKNGGKPRTRASERPGKDMPSTATQRLRDEIRKAPPEGLSALVYRSLEISDPLLRRQMLLDIFARMDAGNFEEMIRESERSSLDSSRNNYDEWAVMLVRAGQVGGEAAMNVWTGDYRRNWDQVSKTMWGWASTDPAAALDWMGRQDLPEMTRTNLLGSLMAGAISKDRDVAMKMLAGLPEEDRLKCIPTFTQHLVQNSGKDGAIEWLKSVQATDGGSEYAKKVTDQVFDKIVWAGANLYNIPAVISDLKNVSAVIPLDEGRIGRAVAQVRHREPVQGIIMLDQLARSPLVPNQPPSPAMVAQTVEFAVKRERPAVEKWLAENPASPIHGQVAEIFNRPVPVDPFE